MYNILFTIFNQNNIKCFARRKCTVIEFYINEMRKVLFLFKQAANLNHTRFFVRNQNNHLTMVNGEQLKTAYFTCCLPHSCDQLL